MIERSRIERAQLGIASGMLDVTRHAVVGHIAMHTLLLRDAVRDGLVTREAARGGDALPLLVAFLAFVPFRTSG